MSSNGLGTSVDEALAPHADPDRSVGSPGCYALEIDVPPSAGLETLSRDWLAHYDHTPPYLEVLADSEWAIYVGAAKDVRARIEDHLDSDVRKSTLPMIWGVAGIVGVQWHPTATAAFEHEQRYADEITERYPSAYVHCR